MYKQEFRLFFLVSIFYSCLLSASEQFLENMEKGLNKGTQNANAELFKAIQACDKEIFSTLLQKEQATSKQLIDLKEKTKLVRNRLKRSKQLSTYVCLLSGVLSIESLINVLFTVFWTEWDVNYRETQKFTYDLNKNGCSFFGFLSTFLFSGSYHNIQNNQIRELHKIQDLIKAEFDKKLKGGL